MKSIFFALIILSFALIQASMQAKDSTSTRLTESTLKLTYPNGGETFVAGSDINITWEGVFTNETVKLEYSTDHGVSWNLITENASGLKYKWENIPFWHNTDYLIRVSQIESVKPGDWVRTLASFYSNLGTQRWSPDGNMIAIAGAKGNASIWDAETGILLQTLVANANLIDFINWSPDASKVATIGFDNLGRIWDVKTGNLLHILEGHENYGLNVFWSPDGSKVATASGDGFLIIWDSNSGEQLILINNKDAVLFSSWSPDGSMIATNGLKGVNLWNAESGMIIRSFEDQTPFDNYSIWSSDGSMIATSSDGYKVNIWNAKTGEFINSYGDKEDKINDITWSPKSDKIAMISHNAIKIWDLKTSTSRELTFVGKEGRSSIKWSPDGKYLASIDERCIAKIWDTETWKVIHELGDNSNCIFDINWSPKGDKIAITFVEKDTKIWDLETEDYVSTLFGNLSVITDISVHNNKRIIAVASYDGVAKVWDLETGILIKSLNHGDYPVECIRWSPDGNKLATLCQDVIKVFDSNNYKLSDSISINSGYDSKRKIEWSPDNSKIAVTCHNDIQIWNLETNQKEISLDESNFFVDVRNLSWSPDASMILVSMHDTTKIWDAYSGKKILDIEDYVAHSSYNHKGNKIATSKYDSVIIRDAINFKVLGKLIGHTWSVNSIDWSNDDTKILTASLEETAKIWDANTGTVIRTLEGHNADVYFAKWSHDNKLIATTSDDGIARIWDAETGKNLYILDSKKNDIYQINWTYDDKYLVMSGDKFIKVWNIADNYSNTQSDVTDASFAIIQSQHSEGQIPISNISPNPTNEVVNITLNLTEKGNTSLVIYDTQGKRVQNIFEKNITSPGEYNITENMKYLAIGSYTLVLKTPNNKYTESLKIVR